MYKCTYVKKEGICYEELGDATTGGVIIAELEDLWVKPLSQWYSINEYT